MTFRISKADDLRLDKEATILREERQALDDAISEANDSIEKIVDELNAAVNEASGKIEDIFSEINEKVSAYNGKLGDARSVVEDIHTELEGEFSDKTERWQEGERGQEVQAWLSELEDLKDSNLQEVEESAFDPFEEFAVEPIAIESEDHADLITDIRRDPSV